MTGAWRNVSWGMWQEMRLRRKAIKGLIGHVKEYGPYPGGNEEPLKYFTLHQKLL